MESSKKVEYTFLYLLIIAVLILIGITWGISFDPPPQDVNHLEWIFDNKLPLFFGYLIAYLCVTVLFIMSMILFPGSPNDDLDEPLDMAEIFFVASSLLLLSSFFIPNSPYINKSRFYDTHPLIFFTTVGFLFFAIISLGYDHVILHQYIRNKEYQSG